jgi:hypothetical protein
LTATPIRGPVPSSVQMVLGGPLGAIWKRLPGPAKTVIRPIARGVLLPLWRLARRVLR